MGFIELFVIALGLSMDAFAVAICKGLSNKTVRKRDLAVTGLWFGGFQALMPLIGFFLGTLFRDAIMAVDHWVAFILLGYIGGKMLLEGIRGGEDEGDGHTRLGLSALLLQGVATSIDALSVGFTISDYNCITALAASLIIAAVTFAICMGGLKIGKTAGTRLAGKASILGGAILIFIGLEIFISSWL